MILDNKVVTEFHQIVEEPGRNLPAISTPLPLSSSANPCPHSERLKGSKSLQIHCCASSKENTKLPKVVSYVIEEPTQPTTHAEMDRAVADIMARISGSEGLGDEPIGKSYFQCIRAA